MAGIEGYQPQQRAVRRDSRVARDETLGEIETPMIGKVHGEECHFRSHVAAADLLAELVVVVVVPRMGQLAGAGAVRARNLSPSSVTIVPPKKPQKRTPPTSMMMPTPPCGVSPSG